MYSNIMNQKIINQKLDQAKKLVLEASKEYIGFGESSFLRDIAERIEEVKTK